MGNDCKTSFQCLFKTLDAGLHGEIAIAHGDSFENIFSQYPLEISDEGKKQLQWLFTISFMLMWGFILEVCAVYVQCASEHMHGVRDSVMRRGLCKVTSLTRFRRFVVKRTNEAQTQKPDATYAPLRNSTFKTPTLSEDNASLLQCGH